MKTRVHAWMGLALLTGLFTVGLVDVARAQVFQPLDDYTSQFSTLMQSRVARALGLVGMAGMAILAITTRGHGMEIGIAAVILGIALFFMFGADRIFRFFGFVG